MKSISNPFLGKLQCFRLTFQLMMLFAEIPLPCGHTTTSFRTWPCLCGGTLHTLRGFTCITFKPNQPPPPKKKKTAMFLPWMLLFTCSRNKKKAAPVPWSISFHCNAINDTWEAEIGEYKTETEDISSVSRMMCKACKVNAWGPKKIKEQRLIGTLQIPETSWSPPLWYCIAFDIASRCSFYDCLEASLRSWDSKSGRKGLLATQEGKQTFFCLLKCI